MREIHERLVYARKTTSYTQKKFAELLKIAESTLNNYETGKRPPDYACLLGTAHLTRINPGWLLTGEGSPGLPQEAETEGQTLYGSDQGQNALKHGSGDSGIDKGNRVNVNLAHSKTTQGDEMSVEDKDILIRYLKSDVSRLKKQVSDLEAEVVRLREKQREAANQ